MIQHNRDKAFRGPHDKWGDPQREDLSDDPDIRADTGRNDLQHCFLIHQGFHIPGSAYRLGDDCGNGGALYPHMKYENKDWIQHNIDHCSDDNGHHSCSRSSLGNDEGIQSQSDLHKHRSYQIDRQIFHSITDGSVAGSKCIKKGALKDEKYRHQDQREAQQHKHSRTQNLLRMFFVIFPHPDRRQGGSSGTYKSGKGGDQSDNGKGKPHSRKSSGSHSRNMSYVDTVYNVV